MIFAFTNNGNTLRFETKVHHSETDSGIPHMTIDSKNAPDIPNISNHIPNLWGSLLAAGEGECSKPKKCPIS